MGVELSVSGFGLLAFFCGVFAGILLGLLINRIAEKTE